MKREQNSLESQKTDGRPGLPEEHEQKVESARLALLKMGYPVKRRNLYHLKCGRFNFYPTSGSITIDPSTRHPERGLDALIQLIEKDLNSTSVKALKERNRRERAQGQH